MFLCAVARPRWDTASDSWFNGLIGCWAFTEVKEAERSSHLRPKGALETVVIKSVTNVEHERMLVDNVIPAIKAKFSVSRKSQPVYIQLDNARPHTVRVDKLIEEQCAVSDDGWDIRIKRQPPNSPDLNVLDLVSNNSFRSILNVMALALGWLKFLFTITVQRHVQTSEVVRRFSFESINRSNVSIGSIDRFYRFFFMSDLRN